MDTKVNDKEPAGTHAAKALGVYQESITLSVNCIITKHAFVMIRGKDIFQSSFRDVRFFIF